jgi:hypothetical protein
MPCTLSKTVYSLGWSKINGAESKASLVRLSSMRNSPKNPQKLNKKGKRKLLLSGIFAKAVRSLSYISFSQFAKGNQNGR